MLNKALNDVIISFSNVSYRLTFVSYRQKTKTLKITFFSWSEFCYWTKVKYVFFKKNNPFKRNTSLSCFFMFFRVNFSQVKLYNISFLFKFNRPHTNYQTIKFLRLCLQNSKIKVNTWKVVSSKIGFITN